MTLKKKLVPSIRFPKFKKEWERKKLNQFLTHSKKKNKDLEFDKSEVLSVAAEAGVVNQIEYHGRSYAGASVAPYGIVRKGELVYTKSPLKAYPYGIIKLNESKDGIVSTLYAIYKVKESANGKFLDYYFYHKPRINRYLKPLVNIGAKNDMKINNEYVISDFVTIPNYEEQQKITSFLTAIDSYIQQLTRKVKLLEQYKKGVMHQVFSQQIRFKNDNGKEFPDWEDKRLGEIALKKSSSVTANSIEYNNGEYKIYGATGLLTFVDFYNEEQSYISIVKDGAGVGRVLICDAKSSVLGTLDIIQHKKGNNLKFLFYSLNNLKFRRYITGSTIPHIYFKDYSKEKIKVPSLSEQEKIASFLATVDEKISLTRKQLDKMQTYKRGLLQQMFV